MEAPYPMQLVGWVVWGKVKSLPWWPGQVMHPSKGPPEVRKMAAMKSNVGKLLVMFLGDNKYAFLPWESVVDFSEHKERHSSTNYASKYWKLGVEEAEELLARRAGLQPATDHQPVDFATKKTNFSNLAKAWAGGPGFAGKHQSSSGSAGRAIERSKACVPQPETSKITAPITVSPDPKAPVPATKSHHRAGGPAIDDGRPKSIGGVMLEWARYMPQVAATRKGAELSPGDATLRFARRLAQGQEPTEVAADDQHALQLLHSFALQRRLRGVDSLVRPVPATTGPVGAAALDGSRQGQGQGSALRQLRAGDAGAARSGDGGEATKATADAGSGPPPPAGGAAGAVPLAAGGLAATAPVVVPELFTISNAAAVPVPVRVVEALLLQGHSEPINATGAAAAATTRTCPPLPGQKPAISSAAGSGGGGGGSGPAPPGAAAAGPAGPAGKASPSLRSTVDASGAKAGDVQENNAAAEAAGSPANAVDRGRHLQGASAQGDAAAASAAGETVTEVDVVLRVNGKLLPHLSIGLLLRSVCSSVHHQQGDDGFPLQQPLALSKAASHPDDQQRPQQEAQQVGQRAPAAIDDAATVLLPDASAAAAVAKVGTGGGGSTLAASLAGESQPYDGPQGKVPRSAERGIPQPLLKRPQQHQQEAAKATRCGSAGGAGVDGAVSPTEAPAIAEAALAVAVATATTPSASPGTQVPALATGITPREGGAAAAPAHGQVAFPSPVPASPPTAAANSHSAAGGGAGAGATATAVATLDLSASLAPWLRGEVRITCWTVCGPRLLLVAVSADRKRDGGLGGIKREARLLLAEAKERRAASPGGPDDDVPDGAGGEQQLKRRLRSATSPPAPAAPQAQGQVLPGVHGSAGGAAGWRKSSPPPPHPGAAVAAAQQAKQQQQQQQQAEGANGLPQIAATGPAAAALMRSRMLQQKRQASAAEAAAAAAAAVAAGASGSSSGTGTGPQQPGNEASKSASSAGGGGSGADGRPSKKVKLVRFPAPQAGDNGAAPCSASRVSSGGVPAPATSAAATAGGPAGGLSGPAEGVGAAPNSGPARRRVSYNQLLSSGGGEDGVDDGQRYGGGRSAGCVTANVGYSCSSYDADWDVSYPPWLPQPDQKGAFITVSHLLSRSHQVQSQQRHKLDQIQGSHHSLQHSGAHQTNGARGNVPGPTSGSQANHSNVRQLTYNHSYNHHHHHSNHQTSHHHAQHISYPIPSPRYNGGGGGCARAGSRRSSGYDIWQRDEMEELPYPERRMDGWSSDAGAALDVEYSTGAGAAATWPPSTMYGVVPVQTLGTVPSPFGSSGAATDTGGGCSGSCEQILLDIRVGDEADAEGPADPRLSGGAAAIAVTVHLPPRDSTAMTAVPSFARPPPPPPFTGPSGGAVAATPLPSHHPQSAAGMTAPTAPTVPRSGYLLPTITPFAEQQSTAPISPAAAAASAGPFSATAAAAAAAAAVGVSPFGGMPPADVDLAVAAAMLADRHMYVCESAVLRPYGPADGAAQQPQSGAAAAGEGAAAMAMADGGGGGGDEAGPAARPSLCEGEVVRLRQECDTLREQVKLRLAPGSLDPLPQQQLPYAELVAQVSERILALALQLPSLSGPTKQAFIQYSRTLMQEAAACGQLAAAMATAAVLPAVGSTGDGETAAPAAGSSSTSSVSSGRSLAVARVAADLVRSAAAPGLHLHPEDRWAFINLAAELLRP